jgi:hypothetical protein
MVSDADKAKQTTYTTDDIMAAILDLQKSNDAIKESNKSIQDSVAALEIRVKALELELQPAKQACSRLLGIWHHLHHSCHRHHRWLLQIWQQT